MRDSIFAFGLALMGDYQSSVNNLKEKAREEYQEALKMPRKKKKKAKKSAMLLYSIACWGDNILKF
jgi:hypothetical protein